MRYFIFAVTLLLSACSVNLAPHSGHYCPNDEEVQVDLVDIERDCRQYWGNDEVQVQWCMRTSTKALCLGPWDDDPKAALQESRNFGLKA